MAYPIYLIQSDGKAVRMEPTAYASEDEFQSLLERYPELLAGEQIDREEPRRWLLVGREVGVADEEDASNRWSLDHLFVDQDGIPTLVEVKRQGDTRLRREVVGQVLDYAANAQFWSSTFLAGQFEKTCKKQGHDPRSVLANFLANRETDTERFWSQVQERLGSGQMRLIFFADSVPQELQRIVEFLNEAFSTTEVLAVEVTRYTAQGFTTHVPRVFGRTSEAVGKKAAGKLWDEGTFFESAAALSSATQAAIRSLYDFAKERNLEIRWGKGATAGSFNIVLPPPCGRAMFTVLTNGKLWLNIAWMYGSPQAEQAQQLLRSLANRLNVSEEYMKQPAVSADSWTPALKDILDALRAVAPAPSEL